MNRRFIGLLLTLLAGVGLLHAVSQEEMEQARTIAAKSYLRWANDGSGYLDDLNPKTMAELEKSLKAKEKENIAAFKAIKTPSDFAGWDKEALVKYWSETFFKSPGLSEKGKSARNVVKRKVSAMNVSDPAKTGNADASKPSEPSPATPGETKKETEVAMAAAGNVGGAAPVSLAEDAASVAEDIAAVDSAEVVSAEADKRKDSGSSVWVYILVLCVLVGVVIWLVIFASKTMKNAEEFTEVKGKEAKDAEKTSDESEAIAAATLRGLPDLNSEALAREQQLSREISALREENARLSEELERTRVELASARRALAVAERGSVEVVSPAVATAAVSSDASASEEEAPRRRRSVASREIYLGRVNAKGLFVRADRNLIPGKSVYRLTTTDGFTGTYRVVTDEEMVDTILDSPVEFLSGGCVAKDLEDTDGMMEIVTDSAGTAIFEDGCWRVLRKAKISYK